MPDDADAPPSVEPQTFGEALRRAREQRGLAVDALAAEVGLDESVIRGAESGATVLPAWSVRRIEAAVGTPLGHLLPGTRRGISSATER